MLSVIVPCYNEERNLPLLAERFSKALKGISAELVLVNNGSTDDSQLVIGRLMKKYSFVKCVRIKKNIGYGHGIIMGLKHARGRVLAYTHADMQCDPFDVRKAYQIFQQSKSSKVLVKGNRKGRFSILTAGFHTLAALLFLKKYDDVNGQPKLFHRDLMKTFRQPPLGFQLDFYVQHKALDSGCAIVSFPVKFGVRKYGYSKWAATLPSKARNISRFLGYMIKIRIFGK
ncbi:MAG: glycosyltransferase family 2 protein [Candidatus Aenigmarchaeota archaeon]|nr:glycosyltransferase family 2 protein [Candidatus Aenigmarchaeota archaeon]